MWNKEFFKKEKETERKGKAQIRVKGECSKRGEEVELEMEDKTSGEKMEEIGYMRSLFLMQNTFPII